MLICSMMNYVSYEQKDLSSAMVRLEKNDKVRQLMNFTRIFKPVSRNVCVSGIYEGLDLYFECKKTTYK